MIQHFFAKILDHFFSIIYIYRRCQFIGVHLITETTSCFNLSQRLIIWATEFNHVSAEII